MNSKKGVASIRIEYDQGDIKVFHGDHDVFSSLNNLLAIM